MDANRFDAFIRALSLNAARRGMVAGLFGGVLASLLASLETTARSHAGRQRQQHDDLSAEKRKKHKKKKHKKHKKEKPRDEASPCTDESCPIPPGCSEQVLDECTAALFEGWLTAVEPCEADCAEPTGAACRACLKPILEARLPDAEACVVESCNSSASAAARQRANSRASRASAREWWPRSCDKPTCCYASWDDCEDDARETFIECGVIAFAASFVLGPGAIGAMLLCIARLAYQSQKCDALYGCPRYGFLARGTCGPGDSCCGATSVNCGGGYCCGIDDKCCEGGGCCNSDDVCCRSLGAEERYCCEHGLECSSSGPHSWTCR